MDRLFPARVADVDDEQLLSWYAMPERPEGWVRFNFVASADGAATVQGRSGGLGNAADFRVLHLLRRLADVLLVGAGTIRAEGYGGDLVGDDGRSWRLERGLSPHPPVAVVSGRLDLDPGAPLFTEAVARPIVVTTVQADPERRRALDRGIPEDHIVLDPGHDLNKNTLHSLELTRRFGEIAALGFPTLAAVSNKDFVGETLDAAGPDRLAGSLAAAVICILKGARIVRMHDAAAACSAVRMTEAVLGLRRPARLRHNIDTGSAG